MLGLSPTSSQAAIEMPAEADATLLVPPPERAAGPVSLPTRQAVAAWAGHTGQQAFVSSVAWGVAQKLPVALGTAVGTALGGPVGGGFGALAGNIAGGMLLGPAHYIAEVGAVKVRRAIGGGCEYTPYAGDDKKAKNFRENSFIAATSVVQGAKAIVKAVAVTGAPFPAAFASYGLDIASSLCGGALSQGISNMRKAMGRQSEFKYVESKDPAVKGRETVNRLGAGFGAGLVAGSFDLANRLVASGTAATPLTTAQLFGQGIQGSLKSAVTLFTWFKLRDTAAGIMPQAPQSTSSAAGVRPPADERPPRAPVVPDATGDMDHGGGMEVDKEDDVFEDALEPDVSAASPTAASHENDHPVEHERADVAGEVTRL